MNSWFRPRLAFSKLYGLRIKGIDGCDFASFREKERDKRSDATMDYYKSDTTRDRYSGAGIDKVGSACVEMESDFKEERATVRKRRSDVILIERKSRIMSGKIMVTVELFFCCTTPVLSLSHHIKLHISLAICMYPEIIVCTDAHMYVCVLINVYTYANIFSWKHVCTNACLNECMSACMHVRTNA